jgi:hypothetical protein
MNDILRHALHLPEGNLLRIDDGAGLLVYVRDGEIWLTQEGVPADTVLTRGQSFRLQHNGVSLLYACEPARLELSAPEPRDYPQPPALFSLVPTMRSA